MKNLKENIKNENELNELTSANINQTMTNTCR